MNTPEEFQKIFSNLYSNFDIATQNIYNSYPQAKLFPLNISFQKTYQKDLKDINNIKSEIFKYKNYLLNDAKILSTSVVKQNQEITKLNKENKILEKKLNSLENQDLAAGGELNNQKLIYNLNLGQNIILLGLIFGGIGILIFKRNRKN